MAKSEKQQQILKLIGKRGKTYNLTKRDSARIIAQYYKRYRDQKKAKKNEGQKGVNILKDMEKA